MNLDRHPRLLSLLAAQYAIGVLRGPARRRLEALATQQPAVQAAISLWQARVAAMLELVPSVTPPASVWQAIEARLGLGGVGAAAGKPLNARNNRWYDSLGLWRSWAMAATVAALALGVRPLLPLPGTSTTPPPSVAEAHVTYMAALHDNSERTGLLITWNASNEITVRFINNPSLPDNQSMQLWGLPSGGQPVSLGVVPSGGGVNMVQGGKRLVMKMPEGPGGFPAIAVSIEPFGGSPNPHGPTGPVVYSGKLIPAI